jgi:formylglycine-generating enzyme required for sulfatase activity
MTQPQWKRVAVGNPSDNSIKRETPDVDFDFNPVTGVTHDESTRVMTRVGLILPHEDQWEYAARAGTTTIWATGDDPRSLEGKANLFDQSPSVAWRDFVKGHGGGPQVEWNDGYPAAAPVGTFEPNAFGMYNMYGNAMEHCSNSPGNALDRNLPGRPRARQARGGNYRSGAESARPAYRHSQGDRFARDPTLGLRPARGVDP